MSGVHFADGFDRPESIAFGLGAPQLAVVAVGTLGGYVVQQSGAPPAVRYALIALIAVVVAALAWGRFLGRPLLSWAWLGLKFVAAPRRGGGVMVAADDTPQLDAAVPPEQVDGSPDSGEHSPAPIAPASTDTSLAEPPWARWLREGRVNTAPVDDDLRPRVSPPPQPTRGGGAEKDVVPRSPSTEPPPSANASRTPEDPRQVADVDRPPIVLLPESRVTTGSDTSMVAATTADDADSAPFSPTVIPLTPAFRVADDASAIAGSPDDGPRVAMDPALTPVFLGATRRIAFFGMNGGVGRTTLATEVACLLASRGFHRPTPDGDPVPLRVALLDLDLRSANVAIRLGIPQPTLLDYLVAAGDDPALLDRFMVVHPSGLRALLGPPKPIGAASSLEPARVAEIVHQLEREGTHFIICDVAADLGAVTTWVLSAVHDIYVVIRPTATGIQDAYRTTEALRRLGLGHKLRYVVNRARGHVDMDEVMGDLGGRVSATIPDDSRVEDAENTHRLVCLNGAGPAATAIADLAAQIYPSLSTRRRSRFGLFGRRRVG